MDTCSGELPKSIKIVLYPLYPTLTVHIDVGQIIDFNENYKKPNTFINN